MIEKEKSYIPDLIFALVLVIFSFSANLDPEDKMLIGKIYMVYLHMSTKKE